MASAHKLAKPRRAKAQPVQHPGLLVKAIIEGNGATISGTARAIRMDRSSLSLVITADYNVTRDLAFKLGAHFGDAAADLLVAAIRAWEDQEGETLRAKYRAEIEPFKE